MSPRSNYTDAFKEQVILECQETGNMSLVARKHNIHINTIRGWPEALSQTGTFSSLRC